MFIKKQSGDFLLFFGSFIILLSLTRSQPAQPIPFESEISTPEPKPISIDKWGVTKINVKKTRYSWTILNYSLNGKSLGSYLESPTFTIDDDYKFHLRLYPKGYDNRYSDNYVSLYVILVSSDETVPITFKFGLMNRNNGIIFFPQSTRNAYIRSRSEEGYINFIKTNDLEYYLHDDKLTIIADIAINIGYTNTTGSCSLIGQDISNYDHSENFENLLENENFSDIQLKVGDLEIRAHRAILASISPVFNEEFLKLQALGKSILEIGDVEPKLFKDFLHFVYTGKVRKIEKVAKDLLPLAKRFKIEQLKQICEKLLCQNLNSENAMDLLNLATSNNATYLKVQALKYITTHADSMADTPSFASLMAQPQNLISVIRALINNSTV